MLALMFFAWVLGVSLVTDLTSPESQAAPRWGQEDWSGNRDTHVGVGNRRLLYTRNCGARAMWPRPPRTCERFWEKLSLSGDWSIGDATSSSSPEVVPHPFTQGPICPLCDIPGMTLQTSAEALSCGPACGGRGRKLSLPLTGLPARKSSPDLHQDEGVVVGVFHRMWPQLAFRPTTPSLRPQPASNTPLPSSHLLRAPSPFLLLFQGPTEAVPPCCGRRLLPQGACPHFTGHLSASALWVLSCCASHPKASSLHQDLPQALAQGDWLLDCQSHW